MPPPARLTDAVEDRFWRGVVKLSEEFAGDLNPYVREKYLELRRAAQISDPE